MKFFLLIVIVLLIIALILIWADDSDDVYSNIKGHESTVSIKRAEQKLKKKKKPINKLKAADINRYNLNDQEEADFLYALALHEAINDHDPIAFTINDRINADALNVPVAIPTIIPENPQNVHDTNVTDAMRDKYDLIRDGRPATEEQIRNFRNGLSEKAYAGFDYIMNNPGHIEKIGASDRELMYLIIGRNPDLWAPLATNLENIIQDNYSICAVGRAAQVLDSLTLVDEEAGKPFVTTDILRKEMMDYCSNFINKLDEENRVKYEEDPDEYVIEMIEQLKKNYKHQEGPIFNKIIEEIKFAF